MFTWNPFTEKKSPLGDILAWDVAINSFMGAKMDG